MTLVSSALMVRCFCRVCVCVFVCVCVCVCVWCALMVYGVLYILALCSFHSVSIFVFELVYVYKCCRVHV